MTIRGLEAPYDGKDDVAPAAAEGRLTPEQSVLLFTPEENLREALMAKLTPWECRLAIHNSAAEVLAAMQFTLFDVVFLQDAHEDSREVLTQLRKLPMSIRRRMLIGLIGDDLVTLDYLSALRKSVDFVLNRNDLPRLDSILKAAFREKFSLYFVFRQVNFQLGRI